MPLAEEPRRILIIRPSALGDVCRSVPVLVSLRRAFPEARIEWVVQAGFAPAVEAHPALDEVIPFPRGRMARWWSRPSAAREMASWFAALRRRRYDLVVDCQGLGRSGLMAFLTAAPARVGLASAREFGWLGYTIRHRPDPGLHTVDEMLAVLAPLNVEPVLDLRLHVRPDDRAWWVSDRERLGLGGGYAVLAPTSRWPGKRWPPPRWGRLIEPLRRRGIDRVVLIGAPGEEDQVEALRREETAPGPGIVDLVGRTDVGQTMAVIEGAALVVANDSAPLHMATGLDRPCVGLFGPTDPARVGPYRRPEAVVRAETPAGGRPVHFKNSARGRRLMESIGVDAVLSAIDRVLAEAGPTPPPASPAPPDSITCPIESPGPLQQSPP